MPLARIRSFDPEAIAFLAAQLAESGYTLQFVRPDETGLENADLELTVVRRDLEEALLTAQAEAERLGVAVTVLPGVLPVEAPETSTATPTLADTADMRSRASDIPEPASLPSVVEMLAASQPPEIPASEIGRDLPPETPHWVRWTQRLSEKMSHLLGRGFGKGVDGLELISESVGKGIASSRENLVKIGDSTASRMNGWKMRLYASRAFRREAQDPEMLSSPIERTVSLRRPKPVWFRERIYKGAAVAAVMTVAAIVGWTLAGYAGPANPVGKGTGISTIQQQVPFGPASAKSPTIAVPAQRVSEKAAVSSQAVEKTHASDSNEHGAKGDDFQEVIVRHFDRKPAAVQAKSKNHDTVVRDGVKIISEE